MKGAASSDGRQSSGEERASAIVAAAAEALYTRGIG
jgi:DNA-binding transcriptional regulator YbjK